MLCDVSWKEEVVSVPLLMVAQAAERERKNLERKMKRDAKRIETERWADELLDEIVFEECFLIVDETLEEVSLALFSPIALSRN